MIDFNQQLQKWLDTGIISAEQAELMKRSVAASPRAQPGAEEGRIPIIAEILGYVGAALAIWAVLFLVSEFWANLADWSQAALFGVLSLILLAAGATILDKDEPALRRLSSVLWAGSVIALGGGLYMVFDPILGLSVEASWTLISAFCAVAAALMLWRHAMPAQQITLFAAALSTFIWLMNLATDPELFAYGLVAWGFGLIWIMLGRAKVIEPAGTSMVLGAVAMLYGAQLAAIEGGVSSFGIILGLVTAALFAVAGVSQRDRLTIILGAIGIFWFVPQAMFYFFGEAFGGMFALFVSGLAIIALAIWFTRHREVL
jgi:hypothetical protein